MKLYDTTAVNKLAAHYLDQRGEIIETAEEWKTQIEEPIIAEFVKEYSPNDNDQGLWHELSGLRFDDGTPIQEWLGHRLSELWINYKLGNKRK